MAEKKMNITEESRRIQNNGITNCFQNYLTMYSKICF